jgi:hypothetical protein
MSKYILVASDNSVLGSVSERENWTDKEIPLENSSDKFVRIDQAEEPSVGWYYQPASGDFVNNITVSKDKFVDIRNQYLKQTDHVIGRHREEKELIALGRTLTITLTEEEYEKFLNYRQDLRELPDDYVPIEHPTFPNKPKTRRGDDEVPGPRYN